MSNPFDITQHMTVEQYRAWLSGAPLAPYEQPVSLEEQRRRAIAQHQAAQHQAAREREIETARAKQADVLVAREQARAERERQAALEAEATMKAQAHDAFLASGGTEAEFTSAWPQIKTRLLSDAAAHPAPSDVDILKARFRARFDGYL
jgi:hypothetical protein